MDIHKHAGFSKYNLGGVFNIWIVQQLAYTAHWEQKVDSYLLF